MKKKKARSLHFADPGEKLRSEIEELLTGSGVSVADFLRCAAEDRIFDIKRARERAEQERSQAVTVRMAAASTWDHSQPSLIGGQREAV